MTTGDQKHHIDIMVAVDVFSTSVDYKYKCKILSLSSFVVFSFIILSAISPLIFIHNAGGLWMRNRISVETANISFQYKYLLIAERSGTEPVVCSSFAAYKENKISDNCTIVKVQEIDINNDGKKDILRYEAQFYTDVPIKSIKLLLFFNYRFKEIFETTIDTIATFDYVLNLDVQKVQFFADLELKQRGLLLNSGLYQLYNNSMDLKNYILPELLVHNAHKKFSALIANPEITWQNGFSKDDTFVLKGELSYTENLIHYQAGKWEELKWLWMQYLSCIFVLMYIVKHTLRFLFFKKFLSSYIVIPWQEKNSKYIEVR